MKFFITLLFLAMAQIVYAEVVISVDTTGWTNEEKVLIPAIAYKIAFQNGENVVPKKGKVNGEMREIIFNTLSLTTKTKIETTLLQEIKTSYAKSEVDRLVENSTKQQIKINLDAKLKSLGLTGEEINALRGEQ